MGPTRAALAQLVDRDPRASPVLSQPVAGAEGAQHRIAALHGALKGGHGKRISVVSVPTDQAPEPHSVSANETRWIPWDLSQGNDTTTVFGNLPGLIPAGVECLQKP